MTDSYVPFTGCRTEHEPIRGWCATNQYIFIFSLAKYDVITNNMAVWCDRYKMLCSIQFKISKRIYTMMRKKFSGLGTLYNNLIHVVCLIEQYCTRSPSFLFCSPISKFGCNNRIYVHTCFGIAQHLNRVAVLFHFCA